MASDLNWDSGADGIGVPGACLWVSEDGARISTGEDITILVMSAWFYIVRTRMFKRYLLYAKCILTFCSIPSTALYQLLEYFLLCEEFCHFSFDITTSSQSPPLRKPCGPRLRSQNQSVKSYQSDVGESSWALWSSCRKAMFCGSHRAGPRFSIRNYYTSVY